MRRFLNLIIIFFADRSDNFCLVAYSYCSVITFLIELFHEKFQELEDERRKLFGTYSEHQRVAKIHPLADKFHLGEKRAINLKVFNIFI